MHAKSKLDESISSLEDSVKAISAMPFNNDSRDFFPGKEESMDPTNKGVALKRRLSLSGSNRRRLME